MNAAETHLTPPEIDITPTCFHCALPCDDVVWSAGKSFCCSGCSAVYDLLKENNLCEYYALDRQAGINRKDINELSYTWMDDAPLRSRLLEFDSPAFARVLFTVPGIHCISCIWLLENLPKIRKGILRSEVNFTGKSVRVDFNPEIISLGQVAAQLAMLGYEPQPEMHRSSGKDSPGRTLITKLVVAGFAFGNIMLMSFPEYLGLDDADHTLRVLFTFLNLLLALPVILYSARDYFMNAWHSFSQRQINIDVPIAAGLLALFSRSVIDIVTLSGPGYLDSLTGLVFFLLIGRWFQEKTYQRLSFERDYKSYFPLSVQTAKGEGWAPVVIHELAVGDRIQIRNQEVLPAAGILESASAFIDYSFVTGEGSPVPVAQGGAVLAGGRSVGKPIVVVLTRKTAQSHLTTLWNSPAFQKTGQPPFQRTIDKAARYFTAVVIIIAIITAAVWYSIDPSRMWLVLASVLMVACPCALALAVPFTYGTLLRVFGNHGFYLKNAGVVEQMASVDAVVFDKTGTVTYTKEPSVTFEGELESNELRWIRSLVHCSAHPLSTVIYKATAGKVTQAITGFKEHTGEGIEGTVEGHFIKVGSGRFVGSHGIFTSDGTRVFAAIDEAVKGHFSISISIRKNLRQMVVRLGRQCTALLSGDNESEKLKMTSLFDGHTHLVFRQTPQEKLDYIESLQKKGRTVMMVGDGLNDAGALRQSNVGIAVTDDTSLFTPACDGILQGESLERLDQFLTLAKYSKTILAIAFSLSFFYNGIALAFACTGHLTPLVAAILMPVSSISVVSFSTGAVHYLAARTISPLKQ